MKVEALGAQTQFRNDIDRFRGFGNGAKKINFWVPAFFFGPAVVGDRLAGWPAGRLLGRAPGGGPLAAGGWRLAAGGWRLAAGGWRLAAGRTRTVLFTFCVSRAYYEGRRKHTYARGRALKTYTLAYSRGCYQHASRVLSACVAGVISMRSRTFSACGRIHRKRGGVTPPRLG